jgi:hypothetical protein
VFWPLRGHAKDFATALRRRNMNHSSSQGTAFAGFDTPTWRVKIDRLPFLATFPNRR